MGAQHDAEKHGAIGKAGKTRTGRSDGQVRAGTSGIDLDHGHDRENSGTAAGSDEVKFSLATLEKIAANPNQADEDDSSILQQAKHFVTDGLVHLTSEVSELDPAFQRALASKPNARTPKEILRALRVRPAAEPALQEIDRQIPAGEVFVLLFHCLTWCDAA
ncbi:MAG: hypothetical protein CVV42_02945 [Candidatus Riflebacteria bacterium HGW-Riflebacteria-2]|nr:MAG: hypothetical protein CVV42_02945 [Candidatus Riflebacteria bacterium HGW-Riflebacteria-2]